MVLPGTSQKVNVALTLIFRADAVQTALAGLYLLDCEARERRVRADQHQQGLVQFDDGGGHGGDEAGRLARAARNVRRRHGRIAVPERHLLDGQTQPLRRVLNLHGRRAHTQLVGRGLHLAVPSAARRRRAVAGKR